MSRLPLHGKQTHALSSFARGELAKLKDAPRPRQEINPGVSDRLLRGDLVECFMRPSPYKTGKGDIEFLRITPRGLSELKS